MNYLKPVNSIQEGVAQAEKFFRVVYGDKMFDLKSNHCPCKECEKYKGYELQVIYLGCEEYAVAAHGKGETKVGNRIHIPFTK